MGHHYEESEDKPQEKVEKKISDTRKLNAYRLFIKGANLTDFEYMQNGYRDNENLDKEILKWAEGDIKRIYDQKEKAFNHASKEFTEISNLKKLLED